MKKFVLIEILIIILTIVIGTYYNNNISVNKKYQKSWNIHIPDCRNILVNKVSNDNPILNIVTMEYKQKQINHIIKSNNFNCSDQELNKIYKNKILIYMNKLSKKQINNFKNVFEEEKLLNNNNYYLYLEKGNNFDLIIIDENIIYSVNNIKS